MNAFVKRRTHVYTANQSSLAWLWVSSESLLRELPITPAIKHSTIKFMPGQFERGIEPQSSFRLLQFAATEPPVAF
ncbi:MAG: hypothetical protein ACO3QB_17710, partial [bacterium]